MALDLTTQPSDIVFARNPVIWQLRAAQTSGGDTYDATGVRADVAVLITDRFTAGDILTVEYTEPAGTTETIVFTAAYPYSGIAQIPGSAWPGTDGDYWNEVAAIVAAHPRIAPFLTCAAVTVLGDLKIRIQAREVLDWALVVTNDAGFVVTDTAAAANSTPDNYRVLMEVFVETTYKGGDYTLAAQMEGLPAPLTGIVYFDISSVLAAECRAARQEPMVPLFATEDPALADNLRRYYVRFTEEYDNPIVTQPWTYSTVKNAIDGGVSQTVFAEGDILAAMDVDNALLSWMPDGRTIAMEQPEYLAWYNYTAGTSAIAPFVEVKWYDVTDGTLGGTLYVHDGGSLFPAPMETCLIPIKPSLLGLDVLDDAYKFTVQVGFDDPEVVGFAFTPLSQIRTYYLDREYQRSERYVQYLNSFGCPECWRCTGEYGKKLKVERSLAERPLLPGYNELASDRFQHARVFDQALTYRTGYATRAEAEVLQEMLIAGEVYDVSESGYIPLLLTSNDFEVTDTNRDLHAYVFACTPRLEMKNFSKRSTTAAAPGAWQEVDGSNWMDAFMVAWGLP